jgi:hypothetical protein
MFRTLETFLVKAAENLSNKIFCLGLVRQEKPPGRQENAARPPRNAARPAGKPPGPAWPLRNTACMYVAQALQLAFAHQDAYLSNEIMALSVSAKRSNEELEKEVLAFCAEVSELGMCITFIIDQTNALDDAVDDRISNDKKRQVRRFLDGISSQHMKISSSSANYLAAKHDKPRQTGEERIDIFDDLDAVCHSLPALTENIC